ncbi:MAG: hypothetical protein J7641_09880 [Cyanobacteria bacterium SID2]|nr:hypothetical protein [Cyanobacteria bacterium SID2]MBP0002131.1 hypothetical protein [Cyanobacteria bacterium SBC]
MPIFDIFGSSRQTYIISLGIFYLLPFSLSLGAVASQLVRDSKYLVFWGTAFLSLLVPATAAPTLRGLPDTGSATLICLAIFIYIKQFYFKQHHARSTFISTVLSLFGLGVLLGSSIVFRRHFAYSVASFLAAMIVFEGIPALKQGKRAILAVGLRVATVATSALLTLGILTPTFVLDSLTRNYRSIYSSFSFPIADVIQYYGTAFGLLLWGLAIWGWWMLWPWKIARFPLLFGLFEILLWLGFLRYNHVHYTLHFTSFVVWGLVGIYNVKSKISKKNILIWACLSLNAIIGLTGLIQNFPGFAKGFPPLFRRDYAEISRLVTTLRELPQPIYVAASSDLLNPEILVSAEKKLYPDNLKLSVLRIPQVDSSDDYPLAKLLEAQTVVVPNSFQYNLQPQAQDVVRVVYTIFSENWDVVTDFQPLQMRFLLDGTTVQLYQRVKSTNLETAVKTIEKMQRSIEPRYEKHSEWVSVSPGVKIEKIDRSHRLSGPLPISLLWMSPIVEAREISGEITGCQGVRSIVEFRNTRGTISSTQSLSISENGRFSDTVTPSENHNYVTLAVAGNPKCHVMLVLTD